MSDSAAMLANLPLRPAAGPTDTVDWDEDEESIVGYRAFSLVRGVRQFVPMLELRFANGNAKAVEYALLESVDFDPSLGIRLRFSHGVCSIQGRNLRALFAGLVRHAVRWIHEAAEADAFTVPEPDAVVTRFVLDKNL